jgi:Flp pilus assembly protein TadG
MSKETSAMKPLRTDRKAERGQILVLFTIAIVVVIGMLGLVLDGGSAFAQRRDEQNASDLAALAGANAYLTSTGNKTADAIAAATAVALKNGYATDAASGQVVDVVVTPNSTGAAVTVTVTKPHANNFSTIMGMSEWGVTAHGTAQTSVRPNGVLGAMPLLFNEAAFPAAICDERSTTDGCASKIEAYQLPGGGNEDVPQDATSFNWTIFCTANGNACNGDSDGVRELINQGGATTTIFVDDEIGPLNAGSHTTLFGDLENYVGGVFPVPIVCTVNIPRLPEPCPEDGAMVGWAYFRITSIEGPPDKVVKGYFLENYFGEELSVSPAHGDASLNSGAYMLKLTD